MLEQIKQQAADAVQELIAVAELKAGDILVIGCSTSEVGGNKIGTASVPETAEALLQGILPVLQAKGIYLAAQCCEHLNRAIVLPAEALPIGAQPVWAVPHPKAGGSWATAVYAALQNPVVIEEIAADAGLDIGGTLIGMHLKKVAVPVRLGVKTIGNATVSAARTRPKYIGGPRTMYE